MNPCTSQRHLSFNLRNCLCVVIDHATLVGRKFVENFNILRKKWMGDFVVVVLNSQWLVFLSYASLTTLVFMFYTKKIYFFQKSLSNTFFSNSVCLKILFKWRNFFYWRQSISKETLLCPYLCIVCDKGKGKVWRKSFTDLWILWAFELVGTGKEPFIYYVITCRGEGGEKMPIFIIFSTKNMLT